MKYQIIFHYISDPHKLTHIEPIPAKDYGEAYTKFYDQIPEEKRADIFIEEMNLETAIYE